MEQLVTYIKPELLVVSVVLYLLGAALQKSEKVKERNISIVLGGIGILLCGIWVFATSPLSGASSVALAVFTSIVQGILVAGLAAVVYHLVKQKKSGGKEE